MTNPINPPRSPKRGFCEDPVREKPAVMPQENPVPVRLPDESPIEVPNWPVPAEAPLTAP